MNYNNYSKEMANIFAYSPEKLVELEGAVAGQHHARLHWKRMYN
jgi:hypothetical protein